MVQDDTAVSGRLAQNCVRKRVVIVLAATSARTRSGVPSSPHSGAPDQQYRTTRRTWTGARRLLLTNYYSGSRHESLQADDSSSLGCRRHADRSTRSTQLGVGNIDLLKPYDPIFCPNETSVRPVGLAAPAAECSSAAAAKITS